MPVYAGVGVSSNRNYKSAVCEAVSQAQEDLREKEISLAIVFTTPSFAFPSLLRTIGESLGEDIPLIGATSSVILTGDRITNYGIAVALISTKEAEFNMAFVSNISKDLKFSGEDLGKRLLSGIKGLRHFALLFCDGQITDFHPFLKGLKERLGLLFPLIGAISSSDDIHLNKTYQYFDYKVLNDSVVGLLWTGEINFGIGVRHGWKPLGKFHMVSSSDRSMIKEIEGRPAVSLYRDYFAKEVSELKKELKRISFLYPLGVRVPGESKDYLLRSIFSIEDDGSIICRGDIPTDTQIRLMIANEESLLSATKEAAQEAKEALSLQTSPKKVQPGIVFIFNSLSRLYLLRKQITKELEIIKSEFLDTPIVGMSTYGEQAPLKATGFRGETYCHNQTIVILAIA